jgi:carbonic anhydrase/acetyltransferase-like protein (isoleucine patch superfamily)
MHINYLLKILYRSLRRFGRLVVYSIRFRRRNVVVDTTSWVSVRATIQGHRGAAITIGGDCEIYPFSMILSYGGSIHIRDRVNLHLFSVINGIGDVWIGSGARIAHISHNHPG